MSEFDKIISDKEDLRSRPDAVFARHLPECPRPFGVEPHVCTVCAALRACEQRVREELPPNGADATWYLLGQRKGVQAAYDAVAGCKTHVRRRNTARHNGWFSGRTNWYAVKFTTVDLDDALAAIDGCKP